MHKFNVNNKNKLDNPRRRETLPVDKVLREVGLKEGDILADVGCGIGYFSIPAAQVVGSTGMVYALDIEEEMVKELEKRMEAQNIDHIQTVVTEEYDLKLHNNSVSTVFICTVLHEIQDRKRFLNEAKRILQEEGKIAVVDWIKKDSEDGPPVSHRVDSSEVEQELQDCGFKNITCVELNAYIYVVVGSL